MQIEVKKVADHYALSQARFALQGTSAFPSADTIGFGAMFSTTLAASRSRETLFEIGTGAIDPLAYTKLFAQHAYDAGITLQELCAQFYTYLGKVAANSRLWRAVASYITGASSRVAAASKLAKVQPDIINDELRRHLPTDNDLFLYASSDALTGGLAKINLATPGISSVYRIANAPVHPDYPALVDTVAAIQLRHVLDQLANIDMMLLENAARKDDVINPSILASRLQAAFTAAYQRSRGFFLPASIVGSALRALGRHWDLSLTGNAKLPERVARAAGFEEMAGNFGLFLAYQDMMRRYQMNPGSVVDSTVVSFSDEEMASLVFPTFREALHEASPFKIRPLVDTTATVGKMTSRNTHHQPGFAVIYEKCASEATTTAFVPIRLSQHSSARFLEVEQAVTAALRGAMTPAVACFGLEAMARGRVATHNMIPIADRVMTGGCRVLLGLPTLIERAVASGFSVDEIESYVSTGVVPKPEEVAAASKKAAPVGAVAAPEETTSVRARRLEWTAFNTYAYVMHIALSRGDASRVLIAPAKGAKEGVNQQLLIRWEIPTSLREPVGESATFAREVVTHEPIEALMYCEDFAPTAEYVSQGLDFGEASSYLHVWPFERISHAVSFETQYQTKIRNATYSATVTERHCLGYESARPRLMVSGSPFGRALIRMWFDWFREDMKFLADLQKNAKSDDPLRESLNGAAMGIGFEALQRLVNVGSTPMGNRIAGAVYGQLRDAMNGKGLIDDASELVVGTQRLSISVFAGIGVLEVLGLITTAESAELLEVIRKQRAMTLHAALSVGAAPFA